jgi:hypothetical protein
LCFKAADDANRYVKPASNTIAQRRDESEYIDETVGSLLVEPDHPVPQGLTIHATNLGRLLPRGAIEYGCNR